MTGLPAEGWGDSRESSAFGTFLSHKPEKSQPVISSDQHYDYAVIGLGVGGLTLAALLAHAGKKVIVFEQHEVPGGYGHSFQRGDFSFCAELHYVWDCGPGERVYRMLEKLGLESKVTFHQLDPTGFDRIVGPGVDYTIGSGFARECERLTRMFPRHGSGLAKYFEIVDTLHHELYDLPLGFNWRTFLRHPRRYSQIAHYLTWTLERLFDKFKFPAELRLILAGQSAIFWMPPRDLSLVVQGGGVGSYNQGAYYPAQSFAHVMQSLLEQVTRQPDCRALLSTEVTRIEVKDGVARSLTTDAGDVFTADQFLFDADAQLSLDMIGREHFSASFRRKLEYDYGTSVVSIYLGLKDYDLAGAGFGEENLFWYPDLDINAVYDRQLGELVPDRPFFFCNSPTLRPHDKTLAPPGGSQLVMVAPCNYQRFRHLRDQNEREYLTTKRMFAQRVIDVVESEFAPGLTDHIVKKVVGSPLTNEFYVRAPQGNCYSTPLDPKHVNLRRLNYHSPFPNLYYVGASSSLPGFATLIHFSCLLYEKLTGDSVY